MFGEIQLMQYVKPDWVLVQNKTMYDIIETIEENWLCMILEILFFSV